MSCLVACDEVAALHAQVLPVRGVGLFSTSEDGSVRVSDLDRRRLVHDCRLHAGPVHAVRTSSLSRSALAWQKASLRGSARAGSPEVLGRRPSRADVAPRLLTEAILSCTAAKLVALQSNDGPSGLLVAAWTRRLINHAPCCGQVAYSSVFSLAISGGRERSALVWQPASRHKLAELTGHASSIMHLAFDEQSSQVGPDTCVSCCRASAAGLPRIHILLALCR